MGKARRARGHVSRCSRVDPARPMTMSACFEDRAGTALDQCERSPPDPPSLSERHKHLICGASLFGANSFYNSILRAPAPLRREAIQMVKTTVSLLSEYANPSLRPIRHVVSSKTSQSRPSLLPAQPLPQQQQQQQRALRRDRCPPSPSTEPQRLLQHHSLEREVGQGRRAGSGCLLGAQL